MKSVKKPRIYYQLRPYIIYYHQLFNHFNPIRNFLILTFSTYCSILKLIQATPKQSYAHFSASGILTSPYYWTRAINLERHGILGTSKTLGLGEHKLSCYWFYTRLSLLAYKKAGALTVLSGGLSLLLVHFVWLVHHDVTYWKIAVLAIFLGSPAYYSQVFYRQNYNALGWFLIPLAIYGWYADQFVLATAALLLCSFLSFTATICGTALSLSPLIENSSLLPLLCCIPAILKLGFQILVATRNGSFLLPLLGIARIIGFSRKKQTKYKRTNDYTNFTPRLFLLLQFIVASFIVTQQLSGLLLITLFLLLLNYLLARFADDQSIDAVTLISATAFMLSNTSENPLLLLSYFILLLTPLSIKVHPVCPLDVQPLINKMNEFLSSLRAHSRIYMAFKNPKGLYDNLFDGQRFLIDYPVYVANLKHLHLFPDFSTIFDSNATDSPNLWAKNSKETLQQMKQFDAHCCIITQKSGTILDEKWSRLGFSPLSSFDWKDFIQESKLPIDEWFGRPKWFLLRRPTHK